MLILKDSEQKYIVAIDKETLDRLTKMADYHRQGNVEKMIEDCILDGLTVAESLHKIDTDKEYREDCTRRLCTTENPYNIEG